MARLHATAYAALILLLAVIPAQAQEIDFDGSWVPIYHEDGPERIPGAELADFLGLPITDAARLRAEAYDPDRISAVQEYQCRQHTGDYGLRGLAHMRVITEIDPISQRPIAIHTRLGFQDAERTIYLDGRTHPAENAPHTWGGFSTATWNSNMLDVYTTHLKEYYIRRNGVPASDKRSFTEHWVRHGNILTIISVIEDPIFLTERLVRSQSWALDPGQTFGASTCDPGPEVPLAEGVVPNYLPGANPYLREFSNWYGIPYEATRGGAETMYPEYRSTLPQTWSTLDRCTRYCTCMNVGGNCNLGVQPAPVRAPAASTQPLPATPAPARRPN